MKSSLNVFNKFSPSSNACRLIKHTPICSRPKKGPGKPMITPCEISRGVHTGREVHSTGGGRPYLVNIWQAAASRIAGDTTSWVAGGDVGHLWMQAVGQVKSAEVCWELHVHTYNTHTDGQYEPAQPPPLLTHANTPDGCSSRGNTLGIILFFLFYSRHTVSTRIVKCEPEYSLQQLQNDIFLHVIYTNGEKYCPLILNRK